MSDEAQTNEVENDLTEKQVLMQRATQLGVKFSNNITVEKLRERVNAAMEGQTPADTDAEEDEEEDEEAEGQEPEEEAGDEEEVVNPLESDEPDFSKLPKAQRTMAIRAHMRKKALALVRVRITNLNPAKKDLPGEILTVANKYIGTIRKYVPFGEQTDDGWHIPQILYNMMKERKFLQIRKRRNKRTGTMEVETRWVREFALDVLEPLTQEELDRLARTQAAADNA